MSEETTSSVPVKPRVLIADDSRIVRAALIKRIEGMFEFREALDGEQAWETLLLDPSIRVVITDLTMPKLDGYGLLTRIRSSRIPRIREVPVVVVSGSDEQEERARARAAGATDLITKGIATPQLLSRLDVLSNLVITQREFERGLEALVRARSAETVQLMAIDDFWRQASGLLDAAAKSGRNFVVLNVCVGIRHQALDGFAPAPPELVMEAIGQLLQRTVRQSDLVARTGESEFSLASGSLNFDSARCFAQRVCHAIAQAHLMPDEQMSFIASCGVAALSDEEVDPATVAPRALHALAHQRALLGLNIGLTGVVAASEEKAFVQGSRRLPAGQAPLQSGAKAPDIGTLLEWMKQGRQQEVLPHLEQLSSELKPLVELMQQQVRR